MSREDREREKKKRLDMICKSLAFINTFNEMDFELGHETK